MITRSTYHGNQSDRAKPLKSMTPSRSLNENPPLQSSKKVLLSNFKYLSTNGINKRKIKKSRFGNNSQYLLSRKRKEEVLRNVTRGSPW